MGWVIRITDMNVMLDKKLFFTGFGSVLFMLLPLFFWGGPDWVSPPVYRQAWDFGHIIFFALCGVFVQLGVGVKNIHRWLLATLLVLLAGMAVEYVQSKVGRSAAWEDVLNDIVGFWLGLVWAGKQSFKPWLRWTITALVIPSFAAILLAVMVQSRQAWQFPLLAGFEESIELQRLRGPVSRSQDFYRQGKNGLKIRFSTRKYSGAYITLYHGDWSAYRELVMDFYNPDKAVLVVTLRISDRVHDRGENDYDDRFNRRLYLEPGWNQIRIPINEIRAMPINREMVLDEVRTLGVYSSYLAEPRVLYWDNVRLE